MSGVPRARLLRLLFGWGALGCIVAAIVIWLYVSNLIDANAARTAPICSRPTRTAGSSCLSLFTGQITWEGAVAKGDRRVTIKLEDATADVGYKCFESPAAACNALAIQAGSTVVTGWWRGELVAFGAPGSRPAIVTDASPVDHLSGDTFFLLAVIPGVSAIVMGLLVWQAPSTPNEVVIAFLGQHPDPPREVDRALLWRATLGYSTYGGFVAWGFLYAVSAVVTYIMAAFYLAPVVLAATFVIAVGVALLLAPVGLAATLRNAVRRGILVKRFDTVSYRGGTSTTIWYDGLDGRERSTSLGATWTGHVHEGDRLDALTDPKSGEIEHVLSSPGG